MTTLLYSPCPYLRTCSTWLPIFTLPVRTYGPVTHDTRWAAVCKNIAYYQTDILPQAPILFNNQMESILKHKVKVMHISTANISKMVTQRAIILLQSNMMPHIGFRLSYLHLTVAYSKGQLGRWNGVLINVLAFLFWPTYQYQMSVFYVEQFEFVAKRWNYKSLNWLRRKSKPNDYAEIILSGHARQKLISVVRSFSDATVPIWSDEYRLSEAESLIKLGFEIRVCVLSQSAIHPGLKAISNVLEAQSTLRTTPHTCIHHKIYEYMG